MLHTTIFRGPYFFSWAAKAFLNGVGVLGVVPRRDLLIVGVLKLSKRKNMFASHITLLKKKTQWFRGKVSWESEPILPLCYTCRSFFFKKSTPTCFFLLKKSKNQTQSFHIKYLISTYPAFSFWSLGVTSLLWKGVVIRTFCPQTGVDVNAGFSRLNCSFPEQVLKNYTKDKNMNCYMQVKQ